MGKFYAFLLGLLAGFGLYHVASSQHIVRAGSGLHLVPKLDQSLNETYVDIRQFGAGDWADHPELLAAIVKQGDKSLLESASDATLDKTLDQLLPATVE